MNSHKEIKLGQKGISTDRLDWEGREGRDSASIRQHPVLYSQAAPVNSASYPLHPFPEDSNRVIEVWLQEEYLESWAGLHVDSPLTLKSVQQTIMFVYCWRWWPLKMGIYFCEDDTLSAIPSYRCQVPNPIMLTERLSPHTAAWHTD